MLRSKKLEIQEHEKKNESCERAVGRKANAVP
jgi:hypothetical protein